MDFGIYSSRVSVRLYRLLLPPVISIISRNRYCTDVNMRAIENPQSARFLAVCQKVHNAYSKLPWLVTVRKRSLGQGNVFKSMYQSFCSQGGLCMMSLPVWLPGSMFLPRGLCPRGSLSKGRSLSRGVSVQGVSIRRSPDRDPLQWTNGWYTSYWNAVLFTLRLTPTMELVLKQCTILASLKLYYKILIYKNFMTFTRI